MEVGNSSVLSGRKRNELMACAFDDGKRNKISRHWVELVFAEKNRGSVCPANTRADLLMIVIS